MMITLENCYKPLQKEPVPSFVEVPIPVIIQITIRIYVFPAIVSNCLTLFSDTEFMCFLVP